MKSIHKLIWIILIISYYFSLRTIRLINVTAQKSSLNILGT